MMRMFPLIPLFSGLLLALAVPGCSSGSLPVEPEQPDRLSLSFPWDVISTPVDGWLFVAAYTAAGDDATQYVAGGTVYASSNQPAPKVDGGMMTVANLLIAYDSVYEYESFGTLYHDQPLQHGPAFGTKCAWGLSGNPSQGIAPFTDSIYLPSIITLRNSPISDTLSKKRGMLLRWNGDSAGGLLHIRLNYDAARSRVADSTLPASIFYSWYQEVKDVGWYNLPGSVLEDFPTGGYVSVELWRGMGMVNRAGTRSFHFYGYSVTNGSFKVSP